MSSGGFLDDTELLAFARPPAAPNVTPVLAQYQRPSFDTAPIIDTANKFAMAQAQISEANQVKDFNAKANPLKLKALQTEVQNGLDQQSASEKYQTLGKAQAADAAAQYVIGQPEAEQATAWNAAADKMVELGVMTPEEAAKWKGVQPGQYSHYADGLHQTRGILENYMVSAGGKGSSYGTRGDGSAADIKEAQSVYATQYGKPSSTNTPAVGFDAFYRDQWPKWGAAAKPADAAPAASGSAHPYIDATVGAAKSAYDWLNKAGTPEATPIPGFAPPASGISKAAPPTAGAEAAAGKAGSAVADRNAARANMTAATGKSADDAIAYVGDPKDEAAQKAWFAALQPGQWFRNPKDGTPMQKRADETLQQAEGG